MRVRVLALGLLLLAGGALAFSALGFAPFSAKAGASAQRGALVRRGPLRIDVNASGSLRAADTVRLNCRLEGRTTILTLVPEGTQAKQGDVLCELDATVLVERRIEQNIRVANADASLVKARQMRAIQESQNQTDLDSARQTLELAELDLQMYVEGERALELEVAQQEIDLAREETQRSQGRLAWSQKLAERGFLTSTELEADTIAAHRADVELRQATQRLDLLQRFKLPRREAELRGAVREARQEQQRVELQAAARLVDFDSALRSATAALELEREKLTRLQSQIDLATIRAPCDGYVVYARRDSDEPPIQEGAEVREREENLSIPSTDGMVAEIKLHESVLKQVQVGQRCSIRIDALPGLELEGQVAFVALLPDQNTRWTNPNTRVYRSDIAISTQHSGLRPGMSCSVEILIEELPDVLHVPAQAVFRNLDRVYCYVVRGDSFEPREVRVGRFDELWVQILDGLGEGESVLLETPIGATPAESAPRSPDR